MDALSLTTLAGEQLIATHASSAGRSTASTGMLHQPVLALSGRARGEHESPQGGDVAGAGRTGAAESPRRLLGGSHG